MDKRYQVFVSSTYQDLVEERAEVIQALLELDAIPAGMELFPAADEDSWELIKGVIDDCDYYIVIVGGRYGSRDAAGISFTEREFDYAFEAGKPVLAFLHGDPEQIVQGKTDRDAESQRKLEEFRQKLDTRLHCKRWTTPEGLGSVVSRGLVNLMRKTPAEGWVRAGSATSPETLAELNELREEISRLRSALGEARTTAPPGAEKLRRGSDIFAVRYEYTVPTGTELRYERKQGQLELTWDQLFGLLGPLMIDDENEPALRRYLRTRLWQRAKESGAVPSELRESSFLPSEEDFQTIKVQFLALGLIRKSERKRAVKDTSAYWTLTPYGNTYLVQLKALPADSGVNGQPASDLDTVDNLENVDVVKPPKG